jgi:hypothetical protein
MLNEAQYAFQNVGYGSSDSNKYAARAKSLARRILKKTPNGPEADAARSILDRLGERVPAPRTRNQHSHSTSSDRHQKQHLQPEARGTTVRGENFSQNDPLTRSKARYFLPGWPLRLMQAISVYAGIILILSGLGGVSPARLDVFDVVRVVVGALLVYAPKTALFGDFIAFVKTRIFVNEDWYAKVEEMPTQRDVVELVTALVRGKSGRRFVLIIGLFFLGGFLLLFAAVFYVVGVRKAFDLVEGWLLGREVVDADGRDGSLND